MTFPKSVSILIFLSPTTSSVSLTFIELKFPSLPKDIRFNNTSLDFDASNITIEALKCNKLDLESDASKVTVKHLQVDEKTSIIKSYIFW